MKRRSRRPVVQYRKTAVSRPKQSDYLVVVRGWMFVVMFALMLGVGAIVGNFINQHLNSTPQVAGASTQAR